MQCFSPVCNVFQALFSSDISIENSHNLLKTCYNGRNIQFLQKEEENQKKKGTPAGYRTHAS